jgi:hypothetical protein
VCVNLDEELLVAGHVVHCARVENPFVMVVLPWAKIREDSLLRDVDSVAWQRRWRGCGRRPGTEDDRMGHQQALFFLLALGQVGLSFFITLFPATFSSSVALLSIVTDNFLDGERIQIKQHLHQDRILLPTLLVNHETSTLLKRTKQINT